MIAQAGRMPQPPDTSGSVSLNPSQEAAVSGGGRPVYNVDLIFR